MRPGIITDLRIKLAAYFAIDVGWGSLLRIFVWFWAFLAMFIYLAPGTEVALQPRVGSPPNTSVKGMIVSSDSSGWLRRDFADFPRVEDEQRIAWIAGSSLDVWTRNPNGKVNIRSLSSLVHNSLRKKSGNIDKIFLYRHTARRMIDTYTMVRDALSRNPDILVVTINPFWAYNNKAIFNRQQLFYSGARLWWNGADWPWQFAVLPPSYHFWHAVGKDVRPLIAGSDFADYSTAFRDSYLGRTDRKVENNNQALMFWLANHPGLNTVAGQNAGKSPLDWQFGAMEVADTSSNSSGSIIMKKMLDVIEGSGIPALIYLAPVAPELLLNSAAGSSYRDVIDQIRVLQNRYQSENLQIIADVPNSVAQELKFKDLLHLSDAASFPDYLAGQMYAIMEEI